MHRKLAFLLTGLVVLSLLFSPVASVEAQDPQPPKRVPPVSLPRTGPHSESVGQLDEYGRLTENISPAGTAENLEQSAITLGTSGLSFRYVKTFGTTNQPYLADGSHLNGPAGIFIDSSNNLYVAETRGQRMLRFNNSGTNTLIVGQAGQPWHHDNFLSNPQDVATDSSGNIWVLFSPTVKKFDSSGNMLLTIPETNPWETGDDDYHFNGPDSIAFDLDGLMYISDTWNQRIQVYDVSGASPVYQATIGETGVAGNDNAHFDQPTGIAFDSLGRLYVMDLGNYRVQRCTNSGGWTCSTFYGVTGEPGNDLTHLDWAVGITVDQSDNIYIADGINYRILKCTTAGTCTHFAGTNGVRGAANSQFYWPEDLATDSAGNVFVSDSDNHRVQKFNSAGVYQSTVGVTGVPYLTDTSHINGPWGIAVNNAGELYVLENNGYRLLKMNAAGSQLWTVGEPGVYGDDNNHFASWWAGLEGSPAVDATTGRIFVPDTSNDRVQIFNSNGSYSQTLGSWGTGNYEFSCPAGIAINPVNRDVYVVDHCNQRIQVYSSALVYKATLGETGVAGQDNAHFNWLWGVAVSSNGDIYVADSDNFRVQKCKFTTGSNYTCSTFAGQTGLAPDGTYDRIHPISVAVDVSGRVYVVEDWYGRVMVYNSAGALLTTIGGDWSENTGGFRFPAGIALDGAGNVYITDHDNHRVQKFAPDVPGWVQSNIDGFGDPNVSGVWSLASFNGALYAGGYNQAGAGAGIWSTTNGQSWTPVMSGGFGDTGNAGIDHLFAYNNYLFAGTYKEVLNQPGEAWRTSNGTSWTAVTTDGFGDINNIEIFRFASFNNKIYASTWNPTGSQVWRDDDGGPHTTGQLWEKVVNGGLTGSNNSGVLAFEVYDRDGAGVALPYLFAGTINEVDGAEIWRSDTGNAGDWEWVNTNGFGDADNTAVGALAAFKGYLYAAVHHRFDTGNAAELWRCQLCDGSDWTNVTGSWALDPNARRNPSLEVLNGYLYLALGNDVTGLEVWRSANGTEWHKIGSGGLNTSVNWSIYWDNALAVFNNELYLGTLSSQGADVWKRLPTFADVPTDHMFWKYIEAFYDAGLTTGCTPAGQSPRMYCPYNNVTRAEMAVFIERAMGNFNPTPSPAGMFTDVPADFWASKFIDEYYNDKITTGCGTNPLRYCPNNNVTRQEMAVFIERALGNFAPNPNPSGIFSDVPYPGMPSTFPAFIDQFYNDGITTGCAANPLRYCPLNLVTRQEMAVFIVRAFGIPVP